MSETGWWRRGTIYQIYPRSFQDSDGDGIGDLRGIAARLDYLAALGVDAIWLSPIFPSPMADFGYDVADYCGIDPRFGTLADFDALLAAAHARGLKLLLDLVPNHTSEEHRWFVESRSSRTNSKRDWYLWRDPAADGGPPNNWLSSFGGPAWEWDAATGQYYYHAYLKQQPDLNWRNPEVRAAMLDVLRFWFDRGVDGFRIDVLWHLIKHAGFPDDPPNPDWRPGDPDYLRHLQTNSADRPEVHEVAADMRAVAGEYGGRLLVGETYLPVERLMAYYGSTERPEVQLPFNFQLIGAEWHARSLERRIARYEAALPPGAWPNWVLGNHDRARVATRVGADQARVAMLLLLTLRGTPTLYYGDELGLENVAIPPDRVQDPWEVNEPGLGLGRDPVRTPMPWDTDANAGFTTGKPWLPLNPDWPARNVAVESGDAHSMLSLTRHLLALRRAHSALSIGSYTAVPAQGNILAYERRHGDDRLLVILNLGATEQSFAVPEWARDYSVLISTTPANDPARPGANVGMVLGRQ